MLISIISLASYELYWSKDLGVDCVANVMCLKRYELIICYLHANYNTEKTDDSSRLFKVKPVFLALRTNCLSVEQEQYQSTNKWFQPKQQEVEFTNTTKEDSQVGIQKLCLGRCLWTHLLCPRRAKKCWVREMWCVRSSPLTR